jgi:hypothetical protein
MLTCGLAIRKKDRGKIAVAQSHQAQDPGVMKARGSRR